MNNESTRNLQSDPPPFPIRRSSSHVTMDRLNEIEHDDCLLSRLLCLHHLRAALSYLCTVDTSNIIKYNQEYEQFLRTTKLRDIVLARISKQQEEGDGEQGLKDVNLLGEAFWLQRVPLIVVIVLSLMAGGLSVVIIYYQQTLAKYIITLTPDQQYKWFGIIVGCIFARFLLFNYLSALANNVAVNVKVGLQNMFMRAIFFLDHGGVQLCMHKLRFPAIEALLEAVTFLPYALVALSTIIGVVVLLFNLNGVYGWVFLGIVLFCVLCHSLLLLAVYFRLRSNEQVKEATQDESRGVFRSLIPLIFDRINKSILRRLLDSAEESLNCDRLYNFCYTVSQFLADASCLASILVYYGLNRNSIKEMPILNTYLSAVYLGMLYFPFKVLIFGSYSLIRGLEQYKTMMEAFQKHMRQRTMRDLHVAQFHPEPQVHAYPDNLGGCFNYTYDPEQAPHLSVHNHLKRSLSNAFLDLDMQAGEGVMAYFSTANRKQMENYIQEVVRSIPFDKTVALISQNHFILPESFQQNVCLYSEHNEVRFREVLQIVGLKDLMGEIEALGGRKLSYRIAKYYPWHSCRLELARALYNSVDYLFINRHTFLQDKQLQQALLQFRRKEGKITLIANSWRLDTFPIVDRIVFFYGERREMGTLKELQENKESALNEVLTAIASQGMKVGEWSEEKALLKAPHFVAVVGREKQEVQLSRLSYFRFFNLAHWGASLVVILGMLSPIGFKIYTNWLIGQSLKKVVYPDIIIYAVLSLFFVFLRGLLLSLYFRTASASLFRNVLASAGRLNGDQLVRVLREKDEGVERDFRKLNSSLVVCFQLGMSVMLEMMGSMVIIAIGQPIVLAMVVPLMVVIMVVNLLFARMERSLLLLRNRHEQHMKNFVDHCTAQAEALFRYGRYAQVQQRFYELHRVHVMFVNNQLWALSGMRMLGELAIIIAVTVFLIIMIETQSKQLTNLPMVSLGVSLFVNMSFSYRFNLKTFAILDAQTLPITSCLNFYRKVKQGKGQGEGEGGPKQQGQQGELVEVREVEELEWRQVEVEVGDSRCRINLKVRKGDRVVVEADSRALAAIPFYLLRRQAFSRDSISGQILLNGQSAHSATLPGLFYLHSQAVLPTKGTVLQACQAWADVSEQECQKRLREFFDELKIRPVLELKDSMCELHQGLQQVLMAFRVGKMEECSVLVMVSAFNCLDVVTRLAVEKYMLALPIPIVISINNHPPLAALYSRTLTFNNGSFHEAHPKNLKEE